MFIGLKQLIWEDYSVTMVSVENSILVSTSSMLKGCKIRGDYRVLGTFRVLPWVCWVKSTQEGVTNSDAPF